VKTLAIFEKIWYNIKAFKSADESYARVYAI
jgi:hypothetical protein